MLPTLLYEALPLVYLIGGAAMLSSNQDPLILVSALIFYCAGAVVWVMRSENRRTDHHAYPAHKLFFLPERLYEFIPFIHLLIGLWLLRNNSQWLIVIFGSLLIVWALFCELKRHQSRRHNRPTLF